MGGGFAGVFAAKALLEKTDRNDIHITLIDKNSYHLFTPSLYEVSASEEPKKNVCIPLKEILPRISMINDEVLRINKNEKTVQLKTQTIEYDYLVIALGSETDYRDIPGLEEYSIPFKTLQDAVKIRELIREKLKAKNQVQVLVGGGGASGCEFSAELVHHLGKKVKVSLIQKSPQLVKELNMEAAKIAYQRLIRHGIEINFGQRIAKVHENFIETDTGDKYEFDIFVWAGGIRGNSVANDKGLIINDEGRILVNENLQVLGSENKQSLRSDELIFAAGDIANVEDKQIPATVRVAREQGKIAALNIVHKLKNEPLEQYKFKNQIFIVPLVGKYAVVQFNDFIIRGFLGWILEQIVFLRYLLTILPLTKAFKRWNRFEEYLMKG